MRKRLTTAARCAIKMRSKESDVKLATKLLRQDLRNGPLHCFGVHINCSTDYCRTTQHALTLHNNTTTLHTGTEDSRPKEVEEECTVAAQECQFWEDAVNEEEIDTVRSITSQPPATVNPEMMVDIQQLVARVVAKADKLLGETYTCTVEHTGTVYLFM